MKINSISSYKFVNITPFDFQSCNNKYMGWGFNRHQRLIALDENYVLNSYKRTLRQKWYDNVLLMLKNKFKK